MNAYHFLYFEIHKYFSISKPRFNTELLFRIKIQVGWELIARAQLQDKKYISSLEGCLATSSSSAPHFENIHLEISPSIFGRDLLEKSGCTV